MKRSVLLLLLAVSCMQAMAQNGNHQPYVNYWFPSTLLTWSAASDPSAKFNKGRVPLATRFADLAGAPCANGRITNVKLSSLAITNGTTSYNPSQGYDHASEYAFGFWQYIDYFVMWGGSAGEGLILAPNPTWIDAGHRNGVKVFGTIYLPPTAYGGNIQWVNDFLQQNPAGTFPIADKLIEVANYYGFDGWFINQETAGGNSTTGENMISFMKYFQVHKTPNLEIMWYDAMLPSGPVSWQGQLNNNNVRMYQDGGTLVSNSMFLDFVWKNINNSLVNSKTEALSVSRNSYELYAGIDVQANGYNTAVNWSTLFPTVSTPNTSVGLYVPSWTFHSSPDKTNIPLFYQREEQFWVGANNSPCSPPAAGWPGLAKYYIEKSSVNTWPFITRFNTGHSTGGFWIDGTQLSTKQWHNQSAQDILPTWRWIRESSGTALSVDFDFADAWNGGNSLKITGTLNTANATTVKLYSTNLPVTASSTLAVTLKQATAGNTNMKAALAFADAPATFVYVDCGSTTTAGWETKNLDLSPYAGRTISAVGLRFESATAINSYSINVGELAFRNTTATAPSPVTNLSLETFTNCKNAEAKVTYTASASANVWYYDVYRVMPGNSLQWLGRTPNDAFYVKNIKRINNESSTDIEVIAVNKDGLSSTPVTASFTWPAPVASTNYALNLDGVSKYINAGPVNLNGTTLSLEGWIYPRSFKTASPFISSIMGIEESDQNTALLRIGDASIAANKMQFVLSIGGVAKKLTANTAFSTNTWYHVAGTYDGTTMKLYINDVLDASLAVTGTVSASGNFYIGRNNSDSRCFDGMMEEMRAWKTTLTQSELSTNKCSVSATSTGLEGYWSFNGCAGLADDETTHLHDGSPVNMVDADWVTTLPCPLGVAATPDENAISLIPNPVKSGNNLELTLPSEARADCYLYDGSGKLLFTQVVHSKRSTINVGKLSTGIYYYKVISNSRTFTGKVVIY